MTDITTEQAIQAAGANVAPRVTPDDIEAMIIGETFTLLPSSKVMVCELTLRNGFTVRGESAVVCKENFKHDIGRDISRDAARSKVWELAGFLLQESLYQEAKRTGSHSYQHRVVAEHARVSDDTQKLDAFTGSAVFRTIDTHEQGRLVRQLNHMRGYRDVLAERIAAFKPA